MPYRDLREFLTKLELEGQLVRYQKEILPEPDIRAISRAASDIGDMGPAVLLDNIIGYKGKKVAVNVHGSWANHALMMGMPKTTSLKEQFFELAERWDKYPGEIKWVDSPPCQEVVIDKDINLFEILPLYRVNKHDGGFYLSKASVVTKDIEDPDNFDKQNVGTYRIQVQGPDTLAINGTYVHDIGIHFKKAERINQPLPVAVCLGVDPILTFMASTPLAYQQSEYKYASALSGIPIELTKCLTSDLDVPARAEFVIEGELLPRERTIEGPFGEFPGSYSGVRKLLKIKVKKVTHRKDPIFENLYVGRSWTEIDNLQGLNTCVTLYKQLKESIPEVKAVNALHQHGQTTIVSTDVRFGGFAKTVAFRLMSTPHGTMFCRNIILVDGDIDPFNLNEVFWTLSTRVRDEKDIIIIPSVPGITLNPATDRMGMDRKLIIDATTPVPHDYPMNIKMVTKSEKTDMYREILSAMQNNPESVNSKGGF